MSTPRIAVVTGGMGGLGTAICRALAHDGRKVVAVDLPTAAERTQAWLDSMQGLDVSVESADVSDFDSCQSLVAKIVQTHGALDILVNNAGITRDSTLRKMELAQWQALLDVNLSSAFHLCRHAIDGMLERGFGRIVNISSVSGQTGNFGQTNYAAAKAGLHGFSMSLARETAGKGVTVNSVSPGYIETPMTRAMPEAARERTRAMIPAGRLGQPEDIARTVAFLSADAADYITGANLPVNGGLFMSF
ncbi:beta-ketoacyl-ACP reductase [Pseudoxanthomonas kalamensis DSM 18571]|uniref:acetoacetyl-CoA reductase n=1 Tax=Pseudoxanthomonas kalamensis TaxID=289483 RepID=UPI0013913C2E|nr:acetoacetyl-CoA reductase [Pseudoxanthomonas kalamensis]KAF1710397.1 beta-ketoacyl-ACP reductase [Pseudoxanthomonas kalamensis DSM 18571]